MVKIVGVTQLVSIRVDGLSFRLQASFSEAATCNTLILDSEL